MTAPTRTSLIIFDAQVAAGSTSKATAMAASTPATGNGGWFDISAFNGGDIGWSVTNGTSAPSSQLQFTIQFASAQGVAKGTYDRFSAGGDVTASSVSSGIVPIPATAKFVRVLGYGVATNAAGLYAEAMLKS